MIRSHQQLQQIMATDKGDIVVVSGENKQGDGANECSVHVVGFGGGSLLSSNTGTVYNRCVWTYKSS